MNGVNAYTIRWVHSVFVVAIAALLAMLPLGKAHAVESDVTEIAGGQTENEGPQLQLDFGQHVDAGFFVAVVKDGVDSYPQTEEELQGILTGTYSPGIYIHDAFDASDFAEFGGELYHDELYDLSGASIVDRIVRMPTDDQIAEACERAGIEFDSEAQTVVWYVVKSAASTWDTVWHIDGLLVPKDIAPEPEPEPEPDVPDGSGSETDSDQDGPEPPSDNGMDGVHDGGSLQHAPSEESDALDNVMAFIGDAVDDAPTASTQAFDEPDGFTKSPFGSAESQDKATEENRLGSHDTPLGSLSPARAPGEGEFPSGVLSEAATTALHVVGAAGLIGVTLGVVAGNVVLARVGQGLSSLDSRLRKRGGGRRQ